MPGYGKLAPNLRGWKQPAARAEVQKSQGGHYVPGGGLGSLSWGKAPPLVTSTLGRITDGLWFDLPGKGQLMLETEQLEGYYSIWKY